MYPQPQRRSWQLRLRLQGNRAWGFCYFAHFSSDCFRNTSGNSYVPVCCRACMAHSQTCCFSVALLYLDISGRSGGEVGNNCTRFRQVLYKVKEGTSARADRQLLKGGFCTSMSCGRFAPIMTLKRLLLTPELYVEA